jgi:putative redox protein
MSIIKMNEGMSEITASLKRGMTFVGQNAVGGTVQMDTLDENAGVRPMQLLLVALARCTGEDILSILQKKRVDLADMQVRVTGKRAIDYPMIWTHIHITYLIWGRIIQPKDVELAIKLSENKYCSVGIMLGKSAKIASEYLILKPGETVQ